MHTTIKETILDHAYIISLAGYTTLRRLTRTTHVGVRALVVRDHEVLVIRHRALFFGWCLPGGGVGRLEGFHRAVEREVREEAGCQVRVDSLLGLYQNTHIGFANYTAVFICTPLSDVVPPVGDIEIIDAAFVPMHGLPPRIDCGSRKRVQEYLRGERGIVAEWA